MELTNYKVSNHAKQRYTERLLNKEDTNSVNKFIAENEEKIKTDLNHMITRGECIYIGQQSQKDGKGKVLNVYIKDLWIILVDVKAELIVTIFKADIGAGDDFNLQYVSKMKEIIDEKKKNLENAKIEVETISKVYKEMIDESISQINQYKGFIKNLESMNEAYQSIIDNNIVKVSQANRELADVVNKLISKKEF